MKQIVLINQSSDPAITNDVLLQIAEALSIQNVRDFAPVWDGVKGPDGIAIDAKATFSVAANDAGIPADAIPAYLQDELDAPGALGYHDDDDLKPEIRVGVNAILQNGGTLLTGSNSISATLSHEAVEALADITAGNWVTKADGGTKVAYETGDPVEGNSYPVDVAAVGALPTGSVAMSNFVKPAWFDLGATGPAGTFDHMGKIAAPQTKDAGGYEIDKAANGDVTDVFERSADDGGMPAWKRAEKVKKAKLPGSRHARRRKTLAAKVEVTP